MSTATAANVLTEDNINPNVKAMEYAVRGPLVIRASEIEKELANVTITISTQYKRKPIDRLPIRWQLKKFNLIID